LILWTIAELYSGESIEDTLCPIKEIKRNIWSGLGEGSDIRDQVGNF
jgi:hypothetical protein